MSLDYALNGRDAKAAWLCGGVCPCFYAQQAVAAPAPQQLAVADCKARSIGLQRARSDPSGTITAPSAIWGGCTVRSSSLSLPAANSIRSGSSPNPTTACALRAAMLRNFPTGIWAAPRPSRICNVDLGNDNTNNTVDDANDANDDDGFGTSTDNDTTMSSGRDSFICQLSSQKKFTN